MRALGIILAGGNNNKMRELSNKRAVAAMPVAGSFRSIDFALSSMANSHIQKVAVLTQYNARSLNEHLSSSKWWDFGRKHGGLFVFSPTVTSDNSWWYRGTADAISQNLTWLKNSHEPYVVIASGDGVYKLDFNKVLEYHIAKRADVTVVCTDSKEADTSRFGDPEAQVVLPRMKTDIIDVFEACIDGTLDQIDLQFADNACVCIVLASNGYPVSYEKGFPIRGLETFKEHEGYYCFHAGTKFKDGEIVTNGGRVLGVTALGDTLKEARANAYKAVDWVDFDNKYYRHDIGKAIDEA